MSISNSEFDAGVSGKGKKSTFLTEMVLSRIEK